MPAALESRPPVRGIRRYLPKTKRGWLALIGIPPVVLLLVVWVLARATPSWYRPLDPNSKEVEDALLAAQDKLGVDSLWNMVQRVPLGDQLRTVSQIEVNSYLAHVFAVPEGDTRAHPIVSYPFVIFEPGKVTFCARTTKAPGPAPAGGVVTVTFSVESFPGVAGSPPTAIVKLDGAWLGKLPIPRWLVQQRIRAYIRPLLEAAGRGRDSSKLISQIESKLQAMEKGEAFSMRFENVAGHTFVVSELRVDDGSMTVILSPVIPAAVRQR